MRTLLQSVVLVALVMTPLFTVRAEETKVTPTPSMIGYVDLNRALNEVEEGKKAKSKLEADGKTKQQKLEIKQKELQGLKDELEKQRLILSDDARREKESTLQKGLLELQHMSVEYEKDFSSKEAELTKPIGDKIKKIIADMGANGSYIAILPKEMVLYAPAGNDITDEVIKRYNKLK